MAGWYRRTGCTFPDINGQYTRQAVVRAPTLAEIAAEARQKKKAEEEPEDE